MKKFRNLFEKSDPCWKDYEMVGMKDKNGKKVPNCVPVKESLEEQIQMLDEMPGANMDTRAVHKHLKKQGWSLTRSSGGHDVFTHPDAKHHIPVPRHRQLKAPLVRGILKQSEVHKEEVEQIDEVTRRGFLKGVAGAAAAGAAGKASAIAGAFPSPSTREKWRKDAEESNRNEAKRQAEKRKQELEKNTQEVDKEQRKNHHSLSTEGVKSPGVGWMLKADPKLGAKVDANKKKFKAFKKTVGNKDAGVTTVKEDNVINTNSQNSIDGIKVKKDKDIERYVTGQSTQVAGTNVVASPRESVQEGVAMDIAKMAARRNAGLTENNDNTLSSYDKDDTPAKKTLSKTAGMVKNLAKDAKAKAKGKKSDDTFQPEPELASNIVR